ncbi:hypothetical protein NTGM5_890009 [Candidatus Nitrotoga sp. M5]|nr:hypothetical protein NTGM5_890009 [Candidatus Nitrotoga sp. M5]
MRGVRAIALGEFKDDGAHRQIEVNLVSVVLVYAVSAAADVVCSLHALGQRHKAFLNLLGRERKLCRHVQAVELFKWTAVVVQAGIKPMEHLVEQVEVVFDHNDGLANLFDILLVGLVVMGQRQVHLLFDADVIQQLRLYFYFCLASTILAGRRQL